MKIIDLLNMIAKGDVVPKTIMTIFINIMQVITFIMILMVLHYIDSFVSLVIV